MKKEKIIKKFKININNYNLNNTFTNIVFNTHFLL